MTYFFDLATFLLHKSNSAIFGKLDLCSKKLSILNFYWPYSFSTSWRFCRYITCHGAHYNFQDLRGQRKKSQLFYIYSRYVLGIILKFWFASASQGSLQMYIETQKSIYWGPTPKTARPPSTFVCYVVDRNFMSKIGWCCLSF